MTNRKLRGPPDKPPSPPVSGPQKVISQSLHDGLQHFPQTTLRWMRWTGYDGWMPKSQVLLCRNHPAKDAILFVHGWGGGAGGTWETFPEAVGTMPEASSADAFFLDYPSTKSQVAFCAAQLRKFLIDLVRDPIVRIVNASLPASAPKRHPDMRYERVLVVAHSMGAVIARRALMDLDQGPTEGLTDVELSKFRLLFFAPAHSGSSIPLLIGSGLGLDFLLGAKFVGSLARLWFQSLRDLEEGSPALAKLAGDCRQLREARAPRNASIWHLRARVYHAHNDRVVSQNSFDQDPPFEPVMDQSHRSICKPGNQYLTPLEALRELLAN